MSKAQSSMSPSLRKYIIKCFTFKVSSLLNLRLEGNIPHKGVVVETHRLAKAFKDLTQENGFLTVIGRVGGASSPELVSRNG